MLICIRADFMTHKKARAKCCSRHIFDPNRKMPTQHTQIRINEIQKHPVAKLEKASIHFQRLHLHSSAIINSLTPSRRAYKKKYTRATQTFLPRDKNPFIPPTYIHASSHLADKSSNHLNEKLASGIPTSAASLPTHSSSLSLRKSSSVTSPAPLTHEKKKSRATLLPW